MQLYNYSQIGCKVTAFFAYTKRFMQIFSCFMHKTVISLLPFPHILFLIPPMPLFSPSQDKENDA